MNLSYLANATLLSPHQSLCNTATPAALSITSGVAISCGVHILPHPRGPAGIKRSAYLLARDTVLSLPKPFQCRPPHLSCINCGAAIAMRLTKLSLSTLSLQGPKACCISSPLPIESTCSGRDVQLLLPFQNLCDSTRRVLPVWVAKLPFHHAIQSCRQPVPTFAIEGFH